MNPPAIPTVTLNNGVDMPALGFGVYQVEPDDVERVVTDALAAGYRSLDTAAAYFNEDGVGRAIAASGISRDELFVTTKLWIHNDGETGSRVRLERSLERLGLDHVDLYLIHQPYGDVYSSWRSIETSYAEGLTRAIGVSNFSTDKWLDLVLHNEVTPAVNQIETHPFHQRVREQQQMAEYGIRMESWGPFAEGRNGLFTHEVLSGISELHGKSVGQVVLRWLIQRGVIVIPKTVRPQRMAENLDVFDFELTEGQMSAIGALDTGQSAFFDHRDPEWVKGLGTHLIDR